MSEEGERRILSPLSPGPELPEMHSLLHQAGLVEGKLTEIDLTIGKIWFKERKAYQSLHGSERQDLFARLLTLSQKAAEMQQVLTDLKQTQKRNGLSDLVVQSSEESEQAVYKQYTYLRLLVKFQESSALSDLMASFDALLVDLEDSNADVLDLGFVVKSEESSKAASIKSRRRANSDEYRSTVIEFGEKEDLSPPDLSKSHGNLTFFETLYKDFTKELKQIAELDKKLKESESRLKSRDEYLQNTIIETAKRTHTLEQKVADLESEKEDLVNDLMNLQSTVPSSSPRLRQPHSPLRAHSSMSTITMQEIQEEEEVEKWIMDANASRGRDSAVQVDDHADHEELLALTQTLTTLAEEKELLESDLCIVRLQVEHLEAISRERDVILNDLVKKRRETQLESPRASRRISRMSKAF